MGFLHAYAGNNQPAPRIMPRPRRFHLMEKLLGEIEFGTSITKLYASLLATSLLEAEPRLKREYEARLKALVQD